MSQRTRVLAITVAAVLFVSYADARPIRLLDARPLVTPACLVDSPYFAVRTQWRLMRTDTSTAVVELRQTLGLVDVPVDSIGYELNDEKCTKVVAALNSYYGIADSTNKLQAVTLLSWGGVRFIARVSRDNFALFDSSQTFIEMMTTP